MTFDQTRRAFLSRASLLPAAPFVANLASISAAAAETAIDSDYKALVCVFLSGGNDNANTLVPFDQKNYDFYSLQRPSLAYPKSILEQTLINISPNESSSQYALAPELKPLLDLFNSQNMAIMLNVGTLMEPTVPADMSGTAVKLPPKLFSHNDQAVFWQSGSPEGAKSGWGGRAADILRNNNFAPRFTCITTNGNAPLLTGELTFPYAIDPSGPVQLFTTSGQGSASFDDLLRKFVDGTILGTHEINLEYAKVGSNALSSADAVSKALSSGVPIGAFRPPADPSSTLGAQLQMVANLIRVSSALQVKRQVFFVSTGGFDLHDGIATKHPALLTNLANALSDFYKATEDMGIADKVTTFTGSDFGRALTANNDGSDHGWGSVHFVLGGSVKGGQFYGRDMDYANGTYDVGQGRLCPSMSVDQYGATLAKWMGVPDDKLPDVFPNLPKFDSARPNVSVPLMTGRDMGFMKSASSSTGSPGSTPAARA